jgi:hypothetical protein
MAVLIDWRTRWGWPWVTTVRNQRPCNACVSFSYTALVESMVRIEHGLWTVRSEGDLHDGRGRDCGDFESIVGASFWAAMEGIADPDCYAWRTPPAPPGAEYDPTTDRAGRTVRVGAPIFLFDRDEQIRWLDLVGPLVAHFELYQDFRLYGSGVYTKTTPTEAFPNQLVGFHAALIVGYGQDGGGRYWIGKNSWFKNDGTTRWGESGFFRMRFGECGIDDIPKIGLRLTNPDPWTKRRIHNGGVLESGNGDRHRDLEVFELASNQLHHWRRRSSEPPFTWEKVADIAAPDASARPSVIQSSYDRNFELVYTRAGKGGGLRHRWFSQEAQRWRDGGTFGPADAVGVPGFIQSNYSAPGDFEVVVQTTSGDLVHWTRANGGTALAPTGVWQSRGTITSGVAFSGPALVQSRFGVTGVTEDGQGPLELACVLTSEQIQHWTRPPGGTWSNRGTFGANVKSPPCMIESQRSALTEIQAGSLELCVAVGGQMEHWRRPPGASSVWNLEESFGANVSEVIGLTHTSFAFRLEALVRLMDGRLRLFRNDGAGWHDGEILPTNLAKGVGTMDAIRSMGWTPRQICLGAAAALFAYNALQRSIGAKSGGRWAYVSLGMALASAGLLFPEKGGDRG